MFKEQSMQKLLKVIVSVMLLAVWLPAKTAAQNQYTNNTADGGLRGSLQVDPSTLGMTFSLPMASYPGRGPNVSVTLNYSSKSWRMNYLQGWEGYTTFISQLQAKYAEHSAAGWTSSLDVPTIEYAPQPFNDSGDPVCLNCTLSDPPAPPFRYIERVLIHLPDGSTHELRKNDAPYLSNDGTAPPLTGTYYAVDGSRMRMEVNTNVSPTTATIVLPDGSKYEIQGLDGSGGIKFIDRHGNTLTYNTSTQQWSDTMGRNIGLPPLKNVTAGDYTYALPGVGGTASQFTLRWRNLADARTDSSQALRYKGNLGSQPTNPPQKTPYLYSGGSLERVVDGASSPFNPVVLWQIEMPNKLSGQNPATYTFTYNVWGEIDKVVLPSGGYERYEYAQVESLSSVLEGYYEQCNRGVVKHWISATGNASDEKQWEYSAVNNSTIATSSVKGPDQSRAERDVLVGGVSVGAFGFEDARAGRAKEERTYNASNVMIRRTLVDWDVTSNSYTTPITYTAWRNPRPTKKVEIILDTGGNALAATTITEYDADLNESKVKYYDYVSVSQTTAQTGDINAFSLGALLRVEEAIYLVNDSSIGQSIRDAYRARNLLGLPTRRIVRKADTTSDSDVVAATEFRYDESTYTPLSIPVTVPGWTNPNTTYRGTVTTTRSWLNRDTNNNVTTYPSGQWIEVHAQTDQCGNPRYAWDAKGNLSEIRYNDSYSDTSKNSLNTYAFPTRTITPIPDPSGVRGSATAFEANTVFEYWTGRTISATDANNKTTTYEYEPVLDATHNSLNRMKKVTRPDGGETVFEYGDTSGSYYVRSQTKMNATTWTDDYSYLDSLARPIRSAHYEGNAQWSIKDTQYDDKGRVWKVSNPYFNSSPNPANPSGLVWTTTTYDALGRVLTVTTPDNAVVTSSYSGNIVTVTDQAGKQRRSETDAAGRIIKVTEDPAGLNYDTTHEYSVLGDLTKVTQGTQQRTFVYDSFKRLASATNPESGTISYTYDANSNLLTRTDARNIITTYGYDNLNRNTTVALNNYQNGGYYVEQYYDGATNGKGRFWYDLAYNYKWELATDNLAYHHTKTDSYDAAGRPLTHSQQFLIKENGNWTWKPYNLSRSYDLAGNVLTQTYPSGRTTSYSYGQPGRLTSFTGTLGDGASRNYATGLVYNAAGQLTKEAFGTAMLSYHWLHYNSRLQMYDSRVGHDGNNEWSWNLGALILHYSVNGYDGTDNNGNIVRNHHYLPTTDQGDYWLTTQIHRWDYEYDSLNRIKWVKEFNTSGVEQFKQSFTYDRWGNRTIDTANTTSGIPGVTRDTFTVDSATNRLTQKNSVTLTYDAAGNQTYDATGNRSYDAENRMTKAVQGSATSYYFYDANGKRTRRIINGSQSATTNETWQVYGFDGELVAEYAYNGAPGSPQKEYGYRGGEMLIVADNSSGSLTINWLVTDHLGTPRLNLRGTGSDGGRLTAVTRHDYLPFGEEIPASVGGRSGQGYEPPPDGVRQQFTGYERDDETGLDFAQARYFSSVQGRFTSPDPLMSSGSLTEPQGWNGYAYVGNRPTIITDPSGLLWYIRELSNGQYELRWFDYNPGGNWKEVEFKSGTLVFQAVNDHLIQLNQYSRTYRDLTAEAMNLASIRRQEWAKKEAERYVNAILWDFISISVDKGIALASGGTAGLIKSTVKDLVAENGEYIAGYVVDTLQNIADNVSGSAIPKYARDEYIDIEDSVKRQVLEEEPTCRYCGERSSTEVDHIRSQKQDWIEGGWMDPRTVRSTRVRIRSNLAGACLPCNRSKGSKPIGTGVREWIPPKLRMKQ